MFARAVVIHGLPHAALALQAASRLGRRILLLSAAGAGRYAGGAWWLALIEAARQDHPDIQFEDWLDCRDAPGAAMAALRLGQRRLILLPNVPAFAAVAAAAATLQGVVRDNRPPALDLAEPGAHRQLDGWLASPADCTAGDSTPRLG